MNPRLALGIPIALALMLLPAAALAEDLLIVEPAPNEDLLVVETAPREDLLIVEPAPSEDVLIAGPAVHEDDFDLEAITALIEADQVRNAAHLEQLINAEDSINNVDLDGDGLVDYVMVRELQEGDNHVFEFIALPSSDPDGQRVSIASVTLIQVPAQRTIEIVSTYPDYVIVNDHHYAYRSHYAYHDHHHGFFMWVFLPHRHITHHHYSHHHYRARSVCDSHVLYSRRSHFRTHHHLGTVHRERRVIHHDHHARRDDRRHRHAHRDDDHRDARDDHRGDRDDHRGDRDDHEDRPDARDARPDARDDHRGDRDEKAAEPRPFATAPRDSLTQRPRAPRADEDRAALAPIDRSAIQPRRDEPRAPDTDRRARRPFEASGTLDRSALRPSGASSDRSDDSDSSAKASRRPALRRPKDPTTDRPKSSAPLRVKRPTASSNIPSSSLSSKAPATTRRAPSVPTTRAPSRSTFSPRDLGAPSSSSSNKKASKKASKKSSKKTSKASKSSKSPRGLRR